MEKRRKRYLFSLIHMAVLFVDGKLTTLTVIVEIIEKVNNTYRTATSEIKRETCIRFLKTIQLYIRDIMKI